jgi:hypothetical protein
VSNSDYTKPRTNLNDYLPAVVKSKIAKVVNENLFNRYFTKVEYTHVDGVIGTISSTDSVAQITEQNEYAKQFQLQPVAYTKVGTIDNFLSFQDLLKKLDRLGVDTSKFNEWGAALQFNWVPPVDLDKLINWQNYYWDSNSFDDTPQYVTIKNQCTWATSRFTQLKKSVASCAPTYKIANIDADSNKLVITGNRALDFYVGERLVVSTSDGQYELFTLISATFNTSSLKTDLFVTETVSPGLVNLTKTTLKIKAVGILDNTVTVEGDLHLLFTQDYVFSTIGSFVHPTTYWKVKSSTFDPLKKITVIEVDNNVSNAFDWTTISILPAVVLGESETYAVCENRSDNPIGTWNDSLVANLIWSKDYNILDTHHTGATELGSNVFNDSTVNFFTAGVKADDNLIVTYESGEVKRYAVASVDTHSLYLPTNIRFFDRTALTYKIVRRSLFNSLIQVLAPVNPVAGQFWVDDTTDTLKRWDGSHWVVLQDRVSYLYKQLNNRYAVDLIQKDSWSAQNHWVHRNEIANYTGKVRAQLPIVEFAPYLELSETSFASKQWKYRKDSLSSYEETDATPTLFELVDLSIKSIIQPEFTFQDTKTILVNQKFGNLANSISPEMTLTLSQFQENNGDYTVGSVEYVQQVPNARFITKIHLKEPVANVFDFPAGAVIKPKRTSLGDLFLGRDAAHWLFEGIRDISSSSLQPAVNPMRDIYVQSLTDNVRKIDSNVGLVWQEFTYNTPVSVNASTFELHSSLHDLVLYDDYQEGDLRVYIDGVRQYGNFSEFRSVTNSNFVGTIRFDDNVTLTDKNVVRIELGEYALDDVGTRAVKIFTSTGQELYNLVSIRKIEQQKFERFQYPEFNVYDVQGRPLSIASTIFSFKESADADINLNVGRRIAYDATTRDYTFEQHLISSTGALRLYRDMLQVGNELQSVWKKGQLNEQYVPKKLSDGNWELPNTWYFNASHGNRGEIALSELFRHFKTIIDAQITPSVFSAVGSSLFYLDDRVNYGVGGTIKEHNNGLDLLISAMFVNNVNPINLIEFAYSQYINNLKAIQDKLQSDAASLLANNDGINNLADLTAFVSDYLKDWFETNDRYDQWFGDSTTFDSVTQKGVYNWIATLPYLGLVKKNQPYYIRDPDLKLTQVVHHDGHRTDIAYNMAVKEQIYSKLKTLEILSEQTVNTPTEPFPVLVDGAVSTNGDYLVRTTLSSRKRDLYRFNSQGIWQLVDLDVLLAEVFVFFEQALYDNLPAVIDFVPQYDLAPNRTNARYDALTQEQFAKYIKNENIEAPYSSTAIYKSNDAFTWNYAYTTVPLHPLTGVPFENNNASWQALYQAVYGTAYPHREPWVLQSFPQKPDWWDAVYGDKSGQRVWSPNMWSNIFAGILPVGRLSATGQYGTGLSGQLSLLFSFVSVNVSDVTTPDGVPPDGLLPPYWDTRNTTDPRVRSLFNPQLNQFITTPQANYLFGQKGPIEHRWLISAQKLYDELIVSFKIDPVRFLYLNFGNQFVNVNCLQVDKDLQKVFSHQDTVFHGDFVEGENEIYKTNGLNQWYVHYNRYNGYDDVNSGFKTLWSLWEMRLSYLFSAFVDTPSFSVASDIFDLVNKDYSILVKKTSGISDQWLDALNVTVLNTPSQYAQNREQGIGWTVQLDNTSPIGRPLRFYAPQNYSFRAVLNSDTFRTYSYDLVDAGVEDVYAYRIISYNQVVVPTMPTQLVNTGFEYWFQIEIDNGGVETYSIAGQDARTFVQLVNKLNELFDGRATASIKTGDLIIRSNTTGDTSAIDVIDDGLFVSAQPSLFNSISAQVVTDISFLNTFTLAGNRTDVFRIGGKIVVSSSTNFDGTYTINNSTYDISLEQTVLTVDEDKIITGLVVNGIVEPFVPRVLPDSWVTGSEVRLNSTGILPSGLDDSKLYYLIRISNREFKLADTPAKAELGKGITVLSAGSGDHYAGRLQSTFKALSGKSSQTGWRRHFSDTRTVETVSAPYIVSGIQNIVDVLKGYEDLLTDLGFQTQSEDQDNVDATGRTNTWLYETEKLIDQLFSIRSTRIENGTKYSISAVSSGNYFQISNGLTANWNAGTQVVLSTGVGSTLPSVFSNPLISYIPYYVIPALQKDKFQLAASFADAKAGKAITFADDGSGEQFVTIYRASTRFPVIELNPFKNYIWIRHEQGVLANVFAGLKNDSLMTQRIYDNNGNDLTVKELMVLRQDKQSRISIALQQQEINEKFSKVKKYMQGMHLFFDGYEHILMLANYSTDEHLIYDSFLGLNTPRFYLTFNRQNDRTMRPNVGGFVLQNDGLVQNFEAAVNNLRYVYDAYNPSADSRTSDMVRKALGYEGAQDYMNALNINEKSQFIFWQGMIQAKGTNVAVNAFVNQKVFSDLLVDEFWAYKLATFGDSKERNYLELKLKSEDVNNKELRLEFVLPDSTSIEETFKAIRLTDQSRWWDQPDQVAKMAPVPAFYFSTKVVEIITDVGPRIRILDGKRILSLNQPAAGVVVTYYDPVDFKRKSLSENSDYTYLNSSALIFTDIIDALQSVNVYLLTYDYDAQNPARIIDKQAQDVVANVPIWNPAFGQYYCNAMSVVDVKSPTDPAVYNTVADLSDGTAFWHSQEAGKVWFDDSTEGYLPYYDKQIYPSINDRLANWGRLAEWADVRLYEWIESDIPPDQWDAQAAQESNDTSIAQSEKKTGETYKVLYSNTGTIDEPVWVAQQDQHLSFVAGLITPNAVTLNFATTSNPVKIYLNGKFAVSTDLGSASSAANAIVNYALQQNANAYVHVVLLTHVPTSSEIDAGLYKYDTPHSVVTRINKDTTQPYSLYYFWVRNKSNKVAFRNEMTIFEAEKLLKNMTSPYMIISGFRSSDQGYGLIYGYVFDETAFDAPGRFTQAIVRGLSGLVTDENRYALKFTRDFALRDKLPSDLTLNDIHTEWKLFREKQLSKIDEYLWTKMVEALVGVVVENRTSTTVIVPSMDRILFDDIYGTDTRFGLGQGQVLTDGTLSLKTILGILKNPDLNFGAVDIDLFISNNVFTTPSGILTAMFAIYDAFPIETVNYIFFQVLHDAFSLKKKFTEIFKTSWVAIQIAQNVITPRTVATHNYTLEPDGQCFTGQTDLQTFEFTRLPEFILAVSNGGILTYAKSEGNEVQILRKETLARQTGAGLVTGVYTDDVYVYIVSINGGVDIFYYNGINFVRIAGFVGTGDGLGITGYNPVLVIDDSGDGVSVVTFDNGRLTKVATTSAFDITNVKAVCVFNNVIVTCGDGRLDAFQLVDSNFTHVGSYVDVDGLVNVTALIADDVYIYTGSKNDASFQIFKYVTNTFQRVYTDAAIKSGPTMAVGDGYLFTTGEDLKAYEFDGSSLRIVDAAMIGPSSVALTYSEDTQRLYVAGHGTYSFSNNKFERIGTLDLVDNVVGAVVVGVGGLSIPAISPTPSPTPTVTPTPS